jgi:hypothetical protein
LFGWRGVAIHARFMRLDFGLVFRATIFAPVVRATTIIVAKALVICRASNFLSTFLTSHQTHSSILKPTWVGYHKKRGKSREKLNFSMSYSR